MFLHLNTDARRVQEKVAPRQEPQTMATRYLADVLLGTCRP